MYLKIPKSLLHNSGIPTPLRFHFKPPAMVAQSSHASLQQQQQQHPTPFLKRIAGPTAASAASSFSFKSQLASLTREVSPHQRCENTATGAAGTAAGTGAAIGPSGSGSGSGKKSDLLSPMARRLLEQRQQRPQPTTAENPDAGEKSAAGCQTAAATTAAATEAARHRLLQSRVDSLVSLRCPTKPRWPLRVLQAIQKEKEKLDDGGGGGGIPVDVFSDKALSLLLAQANAVLFRFADKAAAEFRAAPREEFTENEKRRGKKEDDVADTVDKALKLLGMFPNVTFEATHPLPLPVKHAAIEFAMAHADALFAAILEETRAAAKAKATGAPLLGPRTLRQRLRTVAFLQRSREAAALLAQLQESLTVAASTAAAAAEESETSSASAARGGLNISDVHVAMSAVSSHAYRSCRFGDTKNGDATGRSWPGREQQQQQEEEEEVQQLEEVGSDPFDHVYALYQRYMLGSSSSSLQEEARSLHVMQPNFHTVKHFANAITLDFAPATTSASASTTSSTATSSRESKAMGNLAFTLGMWNGLVDRAKGDRAAQQDLSSGATQRAMQDAAGALMAAFGRVGGRPCSWRLARRVCSSSGMVRYELTDGSASSSSSPHATAETVGHHGGGLQDTEEGAIMVFRQLVDAAPRTIRHSIPVLEGLLQATRRDDDDALRVISSSLQGYKGAMAARALEKCTHDRNCLSVHAMSSLLLLQLQRQQRRQLPHGSPREQNNHNSAAAAVAFLMSSVPTGLRPTSSSIATYCLAVLSSALSSSSSTSSCSSSSSVGAVAEAANAIAACVNLARGNTIPVNSDVYGSLAVALACELRARLLEEHEDGGGAKNKSQEETLDQGNGNAVAKALRRLTKVLDRTAQWQEKRGLGPLWQLFPSPLVQFAAQCALQSLVERASTASPLGNETAPKNREAIIRSAVLGYFAKNDGNNGNASRVERKSDIERAIVEFLAASARALGASSANIAFTGACYTEASNKIAQRILLLPDGGNSSNSNTTTTTTTQDQPQQQPERKLGLELCVVDAVVTTARLIHTSESASTLWLDQLLRSVSAAGTTATMTTKATMGTSTTQPLLFTSRLVDALVVVPTPGTLGDGPSSSLVTPLADAHAECRRSGCCPASALEHYTLRHFLPAAESFCRRTSVSSTDVRSLGVFASSGDTSATRRTSSTTLASSLDQRDDSDATTDILSDAQQQDESRSSVLNKYIDAPADGAAAIEDRENSDRGQMMQGQHATQPLGEEQAGRKTRKENKKAAGGGMDSGNAWVVQ